MNLSMFGGGFLRLRKKLKKIRSGSDGESLRAVFKAFFRLRLSLIIVAATLFAMVIAETVLLVPSVYDHENQLLHNLRSETTRLVKIATLRNALEDQSEKDVIDILEKLSFFSPILGGRLYDTLGDPVGGFGANASLSRNSVAAGEAETLRSPDGEFFDIFVSQGKSGLAYDLILRLDSSKIPEQVRSYMIETIKSVAAVIASSVFLVSLILFFFIIRPVRRMRDAVTAAIDNPDIAEQHRLKFLRRDEIGETAAAINQLMMMVSATYREELSAAYEAIEQSISPVIQYDAGGNLVAANPAAMNFFHTDDLEELGRRSQKFLVMPHRHKDRHYTVVNSIENLEGDGADEGYIEDALVQVDEREIPCLVTARTLRKRNGQIHRYLAILSDISEISWHPDVLNPDESKLAIEKRKLEKRSHEIRKLLESCLILLDGANSKKTTDEERIPVIADRLISQWYKEAQTKGLVHPAQLEHGFLPIVMGHPKRQAYLFWQALSLVYMRSKYETPQLTIISEPMSGDKSEFTILDISDKAGLQLKPEYDDEATDWKLCFAALSQLLTLEGGKLHGFAGNKYDNAVVFSLMRASDQIEISMLKDKAAA